MLLSVGLITLADRPLLVAMERGRAAKAETIPATDYRPTQIAISNDEAFFAALNLDFPGMEKVSAAVVAHDWPRARKAYAHFLRERKAPVMVYEGRELLPLWPEKGTGRLPPDSPAERIAAQDFTIVNIRHRFEGRINWQLNPTIQPGYKGAFSAQFQTQLSRMHIWVTLVEAWNATGNPFYLNVWQSQMRDWREQNPLPKLSELPAHIDEYKRNMGGVIKGFPLWMPLDTGQRATSMMRVYSQARQSLAVSDDALVTVAIMAAEHARLLTQMPIDNNHLAIATGGLAAVAAMFPEFKESDAWMAEALQRVEDELGRQVLPDGAQVELTPWYHAVTLKEFSNVVELARGNGRSVRPEVINGLASMYDYLMRVVDPDGMVPPVNDAEYLNARGVLGRAATLVPDRPDFAFISSKGRSGRAPGFTSTRLPWAGQAVMRSDWTPQALYLLMEQGFYGAGHQHEDKLGLIVNAYGRRILVDAGRSTYEVTAWRDYMIGASAHSTVLVDGLGQVRRIFKQNSAVPLEPCAEPWSTDARFDYASASYGKAATEVFGLPVNPPGKVAPKVDQLLLEHREDNSEQITLRAEHRRHVLFVKPAYWVILDVLTPSDSAEHLYTSLLHFGPGETRLSPGKILFGESGHAGAVLVAAPGSADSIEIVRGREFPGLLGWQFDKNGTVRNPIPTAVLRRRSAGPIANAYVLAPHPAGAEPPEISLRWIDAGPNNWAVEVQASIKHKRTLALVVPKSGGRIDFFQGKKMDAPALVLVGDNIYPIGR